MPAYVIVEIDIEDQNIYDEYKKLTPAAIAAYDGKFVVRGAKTQCLEGDWNAERIVVLEFPSVERAKEWWSSPEYSKAKSLRQQSAKTKIILMQGVEK